MKSDRSPSPNAKKLKKAKNQSTMSEKSVNTNASRASYTHVMLHSKAFIFI
jgi:hypothetical protein